MFNIIIHSFKFGAYRFTITRPDNSEMSGQRETLAEVWKEVEEHMHVWKALSSKDEVVYQAEL